MISLKEFYKGKRVTVLGATGLMGSYMVAELSKLGAEVRAVHNVRPPTDFTFMADTIKGPFNLLSLNEARDAVEGSDIVMNCAGVTGGVGLAVNNPTVFVGSNVILCANILEACHREKVERVGHLSSTVVYAPSDTPVKEKDLDMSVEPYPLYFGIGWAKRFMEKLCEFYFKTVNLKIGVVRPSGAYGRFDNFNEKTSHVLPAFINRALREKDRFEIWGNGKDVRDLVHASDIVRGLLLAVMKLPYADPVNIASGEPVTTLELAKIVLTSVGSTAKIVLDKSKPSALPIRTVDISKARLVLGFEPKIKLKDGVWDTIEWYRRQQR